MVHCNIPFSRPVKYWVLNLYFNYHILKNTTKLNGSLPTLIKREKQGEKWLNRVSTMMHGKVLPQAKELKRLCLAFHHA